MTHDWRNDPATEAQKDKMLFFGCEWDGEITKGEASDAITYCAQNFPDKENAWQSRPATEQQKVRLQELDEEWDEEMTYSEAKDVIREAELNAAHEAEQAEIDYYCSSGFRAQLYFDDCNDIYPWLTSEKYDQAVGRLTETNPNWTGLGDVFKAIEQTFPEYFHDR